MNPRYKVSPIQVNDYNQIPINITYQFKGKERVVTKEIFPVGSNFPTGKSVTFEEKDGGIELLLHYGDKLAVPLVAGLPSQIAQYDLGHGVIS